MTTAPFPDSRAAAAKAGRFWALGVAITFAASVFLVGAGEVQVESQSVIPTNATALEGTPDATVETTSERTTRRQLDATDAAANRLRVDVKDGVFYWSSRDNSRLALTTSGEFTYLSSGHPGKYIRVRRVNDRLTYVEHVDTAFGSVTYWGELRVTLGN
jgi:hypothetical protein